MASSDSSEARELSLVGKVELKIALTSSEKDLQSILKTYLPPLLLKLTSEYASVRNKGIGRLNLQERLDLLPAVLTSIRLENDDSTKQSAPLFNLFLRLLPSVKLPSRGSAEDTELRDKFGLAEEDGKANKIAIRLGHLMLYNKSRLMPPRCPGLGTYAYNFLEQYGRPDTWSRDSPNGLDLQDTKVLVARFLASGAFTEAERFFPALFASVDANSRVAEIGDDMMKRALSAVNLEDPQLVSPLYKIYLGGPGSEDALPARPILQTKILKLLCRSQIASTHVQDNTEIIQRGLNLQQTDRSQSHPNPGGIGLETSKLWAQVFAFTNWIARISTEADIVSFGPGLIGQLRSYVESQGWPRPHTDEGLSAGETASRAYAYESIGLLAAAACKNTFNLELLRWLLTSLSEDTSSADIVLSIEHALSGFMPTFEPHMPSETQEALTSLLLYHMDLTPAMGDEESNGIVRSSRYVALRFANRCLPFDSINARVIDVLALSRNTADRNEVAEEANKGLSPYWYSLAHASQTQPDSEVSLNASSSTSSLPSFTLLVSRFFATDMAWDLSLSQHFKAYSRALSFCRCVLFHTALETVGSPPVVDADWERNIDAVLSNDEHARKQLQIMFENLPGQSTIDVRALVRYAQACFNAVVARSATETSNIARYVLELCTFAEALDLSHLARNISRLRDTIFSTDKATRETGSRIFGLLSVGQVQEENVQKMLVVFVNSLAASQTAVGAQSLQAHGSLLALTYCISEARGQIASSTDLGRHKDELLKALLDILRGGKDRLLLEGASASIYELSLHGVLVLETFPSVDNLVMTSKLQEEAKGGSNKAIAALGAFGMRCSEDEESEDSLLSVIIKGLFALHTVRKPEVQLAVGEALSVLAVGQESKALVPVLRPSSRGQDMATRHNTLEKILERVLADCKTTKPALRQAAVIWLLCLVQFCGHLPILQKRLKACQVAFKGFLADRETLNQETGSRGLTLVYEKGDKELKSDLVRDLIGSFTGTTPNLAGTISADTELFDAGALPTGEGSITTYKDIMSLAAEVGDSSLVYRFMSLASNDALWSSRAAFGRFGLSDILSDAHSNDVIPTNPKLYTALYRYRFDPNSNVRAAMNDIWTAMVKNPSETLTLHLDSILKDLFKSIVGKEWRIRQASCAALADLVQGRPLESYEKYLSDIWALAFKVCDDIKESVRTAAMSLARVLTGILTRALEAGEGSAKTADKMLQQVLPFLLGIQGLESSAPDVQDFSRKTILQIIKKSNAKTLRPFVPELVERLLALLSSIEPEMINYVHMNAETFGVTKQQLDDARLKHVRGSSMLEAIEKCLDYLDEDCMPDFVTHLESALKSVIGLPSKVGGSRILVSLATRQNFIFKPYADRCLTLARKQIFDRNDTISSAYAAACGYLARLASDEALMRMIDGTRKLYFESDEDRPRMIAGDVMYAFSKHATDRFNSFAVEVLPFIFVAKHDQYDRAQSLFSDAWSENVGGSRTVLLYLKEIISLTSLHLESARWSVKHTSAFAIADVITCAGTTIGDPDATIIWPALEKTLVGKTWDGKEKLLEAFVQFVKSSSIWKLNEDISNQTEKMIVRESKRNNEAYRQHALKCLGDYVIIRDDLRLYRTVHDIVEPVIEDICSKGDEMDVDNSHKDGSSSKMVHDMTLANAVVALLQSIHHDNATSGTNGITDDLDQQMSQTYDLLSKAAVLATGNKTSQISIYGALTALFDRLRSGAPDSCSIISDSTLISYIMHAGRAHDQVEVVRVKAAETLAAIAPLARQSKQTSAAASKIISEAQTSERALHIQEIYTRARTILDTPNGA